MFFMEKENSLEDGVIRGTLAQVVDYSTATREQLRPLDDLGLGQYGKFAGSLTEEQYKQLLGNKNLSESVRAKLCFERR